MKTFQPYTLVLAVMLAACSSQPEPEATEAQADTAAEAPAQTVVYYAAPSPMEVVSLVEHSDVKYDEGMLNPTANSGNYSTVISKAVNLGIYGADLSYAALFDQTQKARDYLATVRKLSDELNMSGAFETELLNQLESKLSNRDSLFRVISEFYWSADSYLVENERSGTSALMAAGGWVEGMYIATRIAAKSKDRKAIVNRIAEQKLTLKNLVLLLKMQNNEDIDVSMLLGQLGELETAFSNVEITYGKTEASTDAGKGITRIENSSVISISDQQLSEITAKIDKIRNQLIG